MADLYDSVFDIALRYMAYCRCRDVDWLPCTSSWFPYDFNIGEASDAASCRVSSTRGVNADGKPINDHVVPGSPVLFVSEDLTPLPTIQVRECRLLAEHYLFQVSSAKGPSEVHGGFDLNVYSTDVFEKESGMF